MAGDIGSNSKIKGAVNNQLTSAPNAAAGLNVLKTGDTMTGELVLSSSTPSTSLTATSKLYVDSRGVDVVTSTAATTNQLGTYNNGTSGVGATFTYLATGLQTVNGVPLFNGVRILLASQAQHERNGVYYVTTQGDTGIACVLTRTVDYDEPAEINAKTLVVCQNIGKQYIKTSTVSAVGVSDIDYELYVEQIDDFQLYFTDITTGDVSSTAHGFTPKSPGDDTTFLNGAATPAYAQVKDSDLSTSDVTTNNATTSKHGFLKKLSNVSNQFMNGQGNWATVTTTESNLSLIDVTTNDVSTSKHGFAPKGDGDTSKFLNANGAYSTVAVSNPNLVIGGDFSTNPWQSGTSFAAANGHAADGYYWQSISTGVVTVAKTADAPTVVSAGTLTNHCLSASTTTAESSLAATAMHRFLYWIEGYDFLQIAQQAFTLSFWVKSTKTGTFCVSFKNSGIDRVYVSEYTVSTTNTWEKKTITVSASPSAGTWDYTNGIGLRLDWVVAAGSNFTGAGAVNNTWNSANVSCTSNQVNGMDSTSNVFKIALIKIELGSSATSWVSEPITTTLRKCQRYYEKSYTQGVDPATNTALGTYNFDDSAALAGAFDFGVKFSTTKRAAPTVTLYSVAGTSGKVTQSDATEITGTAGNIGDSGFRISGTNAATKHGASGHFVATSRFL